MADVIRLIQVRDRPLSVDEVYVSVADARSGGIALFVGTVRDHDSGRDVDRLEYSAHPRVQAQLEEVAAGVAERYDVVALSAVHRVGALEIGDIAVIVAVSAEHRGDAITACHALIDDLKAGAPIWKHQMFADGEDEWVGSP